MFGEYLRKHLRYSVVFVLTCFALLQKKLKRKEYHKPIDFANDVELVFSNALEFNQEHTQIWEDATTLRACLLRIS